MSSNSVDEQVAKAVAQERKRWSARVGELEAEVARLQAKCDTVQTSAPLSPQGSPPPATAISPPNPCPDGTCPAARSKILQSDLVSELSPDEITRYSRQLLLADGFGVDGQRKLLSSSILVIGAGGIGSTVLPYLAASGVGSITIVDFDEVDRSNLHRQVIHTDASVGLNKAESACRALKALNPTVQIQTITEPLTSDNALDLVSGHDLVVDACDNPRTRYLVNDACVQARCVLVSGSAMGTEGQLTVYGCGVDGRPCYRCLYPRVNPTEGCKSCSDNGVLGTVPGLIGIMQATEALKVLTGIGTPMYDRLLMYDALQCSFYTIKKPPANKACPICGPDATIKSMADSAQQSLAALGPSIATSGGIVIDLPDELHISCKDYADIRKTGTSHVLLDVRVPRQYEMCALDGAVNIPLGELEANLARIEELSGGTKPVYCVCRRGVASAEATKMLSEVIALGNHPRIHSVRNITGGLNDWSEDVDPNFPMY